MIRERLGAAVLLCYPSAVRIARGEEMLGTLLDIGEASAGAFVREGALLGLAGLRERARLTAQISTARLVTDAFRLAALMWIAVSLAGISALAFADPAGLRGLGGWLLLLLPILAFALLGYDRLAGVCGVAWIASVQLPIALGPYPFLLASSLVPLVGFTVMAIAPRRRPRDARRLAWLLPIIAISLTRQPSVLDVGTLGIASLVATSVIGLLVLTTDPRLAIASSLVWASIGMMYSAQVVLPGDPASPAVLLVGSAPLMILIASVRLWIIRHRSG